MQPKASAQHADLPTRKVIDAAQSRRQPHISFYQHILSIPAIFPLKVPSTSGHHQEPMVSCPTLSHTILPPS